MTIWRDEPGVGAAPRRPPSRQVRAVHLGFYVLFAAIFVLAYLGFYVNPRYAWWLQLLAPLVPLLSVLTILLAVFIFRRARRGVRIAHVVMLILVAWRFTPDVVAVVRSGGHAFVPGRHPPGALIIMVHNAKWNDEGQGDQVLELLERVRPHVVAYQEANVRFLDRGVGYSQEVVPAMRLGYGLPPLSHESQRRVNQPVLTKLPAASFTEISLSDPGTHGSSDASRAVLDWNGTQIAVYSVHLRSYLRWGMPGEEGDSSLLRFWRLVQTMRADVRARAIEATRLREMISEETRPFLMGGDFNATRHNWEYHHLRDGLVDAARFAGVLKPGTYPASFPLLRLDHVFASSEWRIVGANVGPALTSDHRPVVAAVELRRDENRAPAALTSERP